MLRDLIVRSRSIRRFYEEAPVDRETLRELVDLARHSPSGANIQPLRYILICEPERNARIFPLLSWAGYLKEWPGPVEGERPSAYIVILGDKRLRQTFDVDHGIASQSILLGATERGLGGCIIATIQRREMRAMLGLEEHHEILLVLALGKPKEKVVIEKVGPDGDIKYWRDAEQVHHVPKRLLDELIIG